MSAETKSRTASPQPVETSARGETMPIWLVSVFILTAFAGMIYVAVHGGWFDPLVYPPFADIQHVDAWTRPPALGDGIKKGKVVFEANCAVCHTSTGAGSATTGCPPLDGSEWVLAQGPNRIIRIVLNGLAGPIEVKGGKYGGGSIQMSAVGAALTDQQVADALTYVRASWSNKGKGAGPVTPEQVKSIRDKVKDKTGFWSPEELLKISDKD